MSGNGKNSGKGTQNGTPKNNNEKHLRNGKIFQLGNISSPAHQLASIESRIITRFEVLLREAEDRITSKVNEMTLVLNNRLAEIECEISVLKANNELLGEQLGELQRTQRLSDVVVRGVPHASNENTNTIVKSIAAATEHQLSPYVDSFRPKSRSGSNNSPVIVRFSCQGEKRAFLSAFRRHNGVKLSHIEGFSANAESAVYVNESLTPKNNAILREALKLRKLGKLFAVRTKSGLVYVKKTTEENEERVIDVFRLQQF